jgi:4-azaleucine resistance transporter AzlC
VVQGILRGLVLAPGITPLAVVFGATATTAGFSPLAATMVSALVFAGGAQFAAVGLVGLGGSVLAAVGLVAVVNSRYFLLSAATLDLARERGATRRQRALLALGVVDESYALQAAWARSGVAPLVGLLMVPLTLWTCWVLGTLAGALLGSALPPLAPIGLDYALPGIFVGLLGIFADNRERALAGAAAVVLAGALAWVGLTTIAVLVVPPALAFALGRWRRAG